MVPDAHAFAFHILDTPDTYPGASIVEESSLFDGIIKPTWRKYALQMALKLLIARWVMTKYYVTLDADVVVVGCLDAAKLLPGDKGVHAPSDFFLSRSFNYGLGLQKNLGMSIHTGGKAPP